MSGERPDRSETPEQTARHTPPELPPPAHPPVALLAPPPPKRGGFLGCFIWLLILGGVGYAIYHWYPQLSADLLPPSSQAGAAAGGAGGARGGRGGRGPASVTVDVATAHTGDLPVFLDTPGTVTPLNTVTVRSRVDGQIIKVNFTEGQIVKENDLLVQIDPRAFQVQLTQAQGQMARDQALLQNAKVDLTRYQTAHLAVAQQQLDTAKALVAQYEGVVKTDQGMVDSANLQIAYTNIRAPIGGQIGLRMVDQGNIIHASDANGLAVINQIQPITVIFSLSEDDIPEVMKASRNGVKLPVEVLNRDRTQHLTTGTLTAMDSQIDPLTLSARFKSTFDNPDRILFPNQAVNVRLLLETKHNVVLIPSAAVQRSPQAAAFVYVVKSDKSVEMRTVTEGATEGDNASIDTGLNAGEVVVTDNLDKLEPGMKITLPGDTPAAQGVARGSGARGARSGRAGANGSSSAGGSASANGGNSSGGILAQGPGGASTQADTTTLTRDHARREAGSGTASGAMSSASASISTTTTQSGAPGGARGRRGRRGGS